MVQKKHFTQRKSKAKIICKKVKPADHALEVLKDVKG